MVLPRVFNLDRNLRVTTPEQADLSVRIEITSYSKTPAVYDASQNISGYEINVSARVETIDQVRNEEFFAEQVVVRNIYQPEEKSEEDAIQEVIEKLAREIVRRIVTSW